MLKKDRDLKSRNFYRILISIFVMPLILFFQNCENFTAVQLSEPPVGESPLANTDISAARGLSLFSQNCAECHGLADTTSIRGRIANQITISITAVPVMNKFSNILSSYDIQAIANALVIGGGGGVVIPPAGRPEFACESNTFSMTPLLKLTNREFRNSISSLLDDVSTSLKNDSALQNLMNSMPSDSVIEDRNLLKEQAKLVTQLGVTSSFNISFRASEVLSESSGLNTYPNTSGCLASGTLSESCYISFIRELSSRAFRRPVSAQEAQSISTTLRDTSLSKAQQIQFAFTAITQMPDFQYKAFDQGAATSVARVLTLTPHEIAAKISYFLTGFPPDTQLRSLADSGQISNASVLRSEVDRLLALPSAQNTIARLFRESYGYDQYDSFNYSSGFLNGISTTNLRQAMNSELDSYFSNLILNQNATFFDVFTSRTSNINNNDLAQIYGVSPGANVTLPAVRSGFLNRAAMLTKRSGNRASPIKRGLSVLEHVLCVDVGLPPPSAPTSLPMPNPNEILTTRESTFRSTENQGSTCIGCHFRINNLGYPFESFDTLGRVRTEERVYDGMGAVIASLPVNTATTTREVTSSSVNISHSVQLAEALGRSDKAIMCFTKHLKEFESRSNVATSDGCQMNETLQTLYDRSNQQGSVAESIRSLILSDKFTKWRY